MKEQKTEIRYVLCGERKIEYLLTRKKVKNINLRIRPEGKVLVSAPRGISVSYIDEFIRMKQSFILNALDKYENRKHSASSPKQYVNGEKFTILGKCFYLRVIQGEKESVEVQETFLFLKVKDQDNYKHKEKLIKNWLREIQIVTFEQICVDVYELFKVYHVDYPTLKIRKMTSRWGSCQPRKGIITLNSKLVEAPRRCIEYVILHEFAHFIHPNHSKEFYQFVGMLMPDWRERKNELNNR